jgi:hypothetical protein
VSSWVPMMPRLAANPATSLESFSAQTATASPAGTPAHTQTSRYASQKPNMCVIITWFLVLACILLLQVLH